MNAKTLFLIFTFFPFFSFSQHRSSISIGAGILSERFSDRNIGSLEFGGGGYEMGLSVRYKFNSGFSFRGAFSNMTSELSHELTPITLNTNSTCIDLILFKELFKKNQNTFSLGIGYTRLNETRQGKESNLTQMTENMQGLTVNPHYELDFNWLLITYTAVIPIVSEIYSQAYVGNWQYEKKTISFHNYLSIFMQPIAFFKVSPNQSVGIGYSWYLRNNEVAKPIHKSFHTLRVLYSFNL